MRDPDEFPVRKRFLDRFAGIREGRDFQQNLVSDSKADAWNDVGPLNSLYRKVLASGSNVDGMSFLLERLDQFQRIYTDGPFWSAVVDFIVLRVSSETRMRQSCATNASLGDSAT